ILLQQYFLEPLNGVGVIDPGRGTPGLRVSAARPNPTASATSVRLELSRAARVRLEVVDLAGRVVRAIDAGVVAAGSHDLAWDGRSDRGSAVRPGLYWLRVRAGGEEALRRVVRLD